MGEKQGLGLCIWDAYRPVKAVDHFLRWKDVIDVPVIRSKYYPNMTKAELFRQGFIAPGNSSHSRGSTVDITLIDLKTGKYLDMGTTFDHFGQESMTCFEKLTK